MAVAMTPDDDRQACLREAFRIEEDATFTSKGHYNTAEIWNAWHYRLGIAAAVLSALAGFLALADFENHSIYAACIAFLVASITGVVTLLNPSEKAALHLQSGNDFNALKDQARQVRKLSPQSESLGRLRQNIEVLAARKAELNKAAPQVMKSAFLSAMHGIEKGENDYEADRANTSHADR